MYTPFNYYLSISALITEIICNLLLMENCFTREFFHIPAIIADTEGLNIYRV